MNGHLGTELIVKPVKKTVLCPVQQGREGIRAGGVGFENMGNLFRKAGRISYLVSKGKAQHLSDFFGRDQFCIPLLSCNPECIYSKYYTIEPRKNKEGKRIILLFRKKCFAKGKKSGKKPENAERRKYPNP